MHSTSVVPPLLSCPKKQNRLITMRLMIMFYNLPAAGVQGLKAADMNDNVQTWRL